MTRKYHKLILVFVLVSAVLLVFSSGIYAKTLKVSARAHYVDAFNQVFKKYTNEWAKKNGVDVDLELVAYGELGIKASAIATAKAGPDISAFSGLDSILYQDLLTPVNDVAKKIEQTGEGIYSFISPVSLVGDTWIAIPIHFDPVFNLVRVDVLKKLGLEVPDTWADVLRIAPKLKEAGYPVAYPLGHALGDGHSFANSLLWSFGGRVVDENMNIVIDSDETRMALVFARDLYQYMPSQVTGWHDGSNNVAYLADTVGITVNSPSIYDAATKQAPDMAEGMDLLLMPRGPAGRHNPTEVITLGIWKWSKNKKLAKSYIEYMFDVNRYKELMLAGGGSIAPVTKIYERIGLFEDPKLRNIATIGKYSHLLSWPAKPHAEYARVANTFVIIDMFANVVTNRATLDEAISWAVDELKDIYGK